MPDSNYNHDLREPITHLPNVYVPQYGLPDYLHPGFMMEIDRPSVRTILQVGCFDASDTVILRDTFPAEIHAFECNPDILPQARRTVSGLDRIHLVEGAAWDAECRLPFFPVVSSVESGRPSHNRGASSCFEARPDYIARYEQHEITVEAIRLDAYCAAHQISQIDLLCIDVQGAALRVLHGLGEFVGKVRYVITEIEVLPIYYGQALYPEIHAYLKLNGLRQKAEVYRDPWFSDYLYSRD
jgi:FkbM family methyltransferase